MAVAMPVCSPKTIRQVRGDVEFAAADVDLAFGGFAEGNDAGVQPMDQRAQRNEVEASAVRNIQSVFHVL